MTFFSWVEIVLFGNEQIESEQFVKRDGKINVPLIGPVLVAGLTYQDATEMLSEKIKREVIGTDLSLSLTELRSINVYILGEAYRPGSYTVSALSSITNILFVSGGTSEMGSLRNIQVKRNGEVVHNYDFMIYFYVVTLIRNSGLKMEILLYTFHRK